MPEQMAESLVKTLVEDAVAQACSLAALAGRPRCAKLQAALAAARLRYLALCHRTISDRLMLEAQRFEPSPALAA